jgi:RNA polymerase sigma factor (sigma-70 family)
MPTPKTSTGFESINKQINDRIQEISLKLKKGTYTKREKNEIAELIYPKLKYHIWKFCKNDYDTEEALHFTLHKIFKNIHQFNPETGRFTTWAFTIAKNETLYYLDRKNKDIPYYIEINEVFSDIFKGNDLSNNEEERQIELSSIYDKTILEIFNLNDEVLKNIAIDKIVNNDKVKEIALKYDMKENTVKTKLRKARFEIKKSMLKKDPLVNEKLLELLPNFKAKIQ